ncbi:MAG TPA: NrfD/PsrC family molybdoenzyme membrane anchor subunit [Actinomycetota bacterium]
MTKYGFAIDHRACIGCHACTVACKMENDVPLGVFRTWVKYIEKGNFPDAKRYFSVLRCNHCEDAPCTNICPTSALFTRDDGIVDFDNSVCIGCKACMQACPYDALYLDPGTQTAAKCNFCAHRVEVNLEPACVIVCPTHAIIAGDLDDPLSEITQFVSRQETQVRAPEQGTKPKVFYVGADEAAIDPTQTTLPDAYMWSEVNLLDGQLQPRIDEAEARARTVYDIDHPMPWGWKVSAYLWTKSIGAGVAMLAAAAMLRGYGRIPLLATFAPAVALVMTALTGALLVADLKRPERFWMLVVKGNPKSWLVRGAWVLGAYSALLVAWMAGRVLDLPHLVDAVRWPAIPLAALAAAYTAWLFGQAEGRDLWQSPLLAPVLIAQATLVGSASLLLASLFAGGEETQVLMTRVLVASAVGWAALTLVEFSSHSTQQAAKAARNLIRGPYAAWFWTGVALGMVAPAGLGALALVTENSGPMVAGAIAALGGLVFYEHGFVRAGQSVPLS